MIRAFACLLCLSLPAALAGKDAAQSGQGAVLRGLDKVSGKTIDVEMRSGGTAQVFDLWVALSDCRYPAENPTGDAFAYMTINQEGGNALLFEGWMVASSPALNALDHARYDVWVIRCMTS